MIAGLPRSGGFQPPKCGSKMLPLHQHAPAGEVGRTISHEAPRAAAAAAARHTRLEEAAAMHPDDDTTPVSGREPDTGSSMPAADPPETEPRARRMTPPSATGPPHSACAGNATSIATRKKKKPFNAEVAEDSRRTR